MVEQRGRASARHGVERVYLDVPYAEKDEAKALGARWDQAARRWFDPSPPTAALQRWAARLDVPDLLPGEDRAFGDGLFVDMVPRSCWFTNVRSCVAQQDWERLRRMVTGRAGQRCEVCGAGPGGEPVTSRLDVHERWAYDEAHGVQALRRLICLCEACHESTHLGLANIQGRAGAALAHLQRVTGMSDAEVSSHVNAANDAWTRRSARVWELDLGMLTDAGVTLARPGVPEQRRAEVDEALQRVRQAVMPPPDRAPRPVSPATVTPRPVQPPAPVHDVDLARNGPGIAVTHEAARRRSAEGAGADRSWRVGADGEATVAALLTDLTEPSLWERMRDRRPRWRVLHSVPLLDRTGRPRGDVDHVLIGPPGVVTINTKHHHAGRVALDGDELTVNRHRTDYLAKAQREAERATGLMRPALAASGHDALAQRITVRPMIVVVGARLLVSEWAVGVNVVMPRQLVHTLTSMPERLAAAEVDELFETARRGRTWMEPERS